MSLNKGEECDLKISKKLCFLLRHGAVRKGLNIRPDGFVKVSKVLKAIPECSLIDLQRSVVTGKEKSYTLNLGEFLMIKANHGHTIPEVNSLNRKHFTDVSFDTIHDNYFSCYEKIKSRRMKRNHRHFAKNINYICGLKKSAEILIYIDFHKACKDGIKFYESENNVIVSPGDLISYIIPKYFLKVTTRSGQVL